MPAVENRERVETVLSTLMERFVEGGYPYNRPDAFLPQQLVPTDVRKDPLRLARYLMIACLYMRGGIRSNTAMKGLAKLYRIHPELFDFTTVMHADVAWLSGVLPSVGLAFGHSENIIPRFWTTNATRMVERWQGDPRNIFKGVSTFDQAMELVANDKKGGGFLGFQAKMVSMLLYFLTEEGLIDDFDFPPPVDFHLKRIAIATGMVEGFEPGENMNSDATEALLREIYLGYCLRHGFSSRRISDAVWTLSMVLCGTAPGNRTRKLTLPDGTEINELVEVDPRNRTQRAAYAATCAQCPLDLGPLCKLNVVSSEYYEEGDLFAARPRLRLVEPFTAPTLF